MATRAPTPDLELVGEARSYAPFDTYRRLRSAAPTFKLARLDFEAIGRLTDVFKRPQGHERHQDRLRTRRRHARHCDKAAAARDAKGARFDLEAPKAKRVKALIDQGRFDVTLRRPPVCRSRPSRVSSDHPRWAASK